MNISFISNAPRKTTEEEEEGEAPGSQAEAYKYDPEEKGETWDIYKQRSIMESGSKRKSEDAVLIKAKADAAMRADAVSSAVAAATSACTPASAGRTIKSRTAVVATSPVVIPTDEELAARREAEQEEDSEDDEDDEEEDNE